MNKRNLIDFAQFFAIFMMSISISTNVNAQERRVNGWMSYIEMGPSILQHEEINIALDSQGYGSLAKTYFSLGAGFESVQKRWIIGGKVYGFMVDSSFVYGNEAYLHYYYGNLHLGYNLSRPGVNTLFYPTIGFGGGVGHLRIKPLSEPVSAKHWTTGGLMDLAINLKHITAFEETDDNAGFVLGFTIGYQHDFNKGWQAQKLVPDQVISFSPGGFYVRLSVGIGKLSSLGGDDD